MLVAPTKCLILRGCQSIQGCLSPVRYSSLFSTRPGPGTTRPSPGTTRPAPTTTRPNRGTTRPSRRTTRPDRTMVWLETHNFKIPVTANHPVMMANGAEKQVMSYWEHGSLSKCSCKTGMTGEMKEKPRSCSKMPTQSVIIGEHVCSPKCS